MNSGVRGAGSCSRGRGRPVKHRGDGLDDSERRPRNTGRTRKRETTEGRAGQPNCQTDRPRGEPTSRTAAADGNTAWDWTATGLAGSRVMDSFAGKHELPCRRPRSVTRLVVGSLTSLSVP